MQPYFNKGHRLFLDNFYTSPRLTSYLLERQTTLFGTVRLNRRDFPADIALADIECDQMKFSLSDTGVCNGSGELVIGVADCNIRSINTS